MFRLAHLSDIHLGPLPDVSYRDLVSKRITGYINWQRNRASMLHADVIERIVADLKAQAPDHVAVTGDLMNLALDAEVELALRWLETLGEAADVSVVPGNHDAYVPGSVAKVRRAWGAWMSGDDDAARQLRFPYLRERGKVAVIGVSSAHATAPFMASGHFGSGQAKRLGAILDETGRKGFFRVVLIHHPPVRGAATTHKRLFGIGRFQETVRRHGAELVLHGHTHLPTTYSIEGPKTPVPVIGVAAAGQQPGGRRPAAQYNLFEIEGGTGDWRVALTRRGFTGLASGVETVTTESFENGVS